MDQDTLTNFAFSRRGRAVAEQPISYLISEAIANPQVISLAAGLVDYPSLPGAEVAKLMAEILADPKQAQAALQYGMTEGLAELRTELYLHMAKLDRVDSENYPGSADDIIVSTGSQQLLHILTDLLVDPGDIVITAWPSYFVYTGTLTAMSATVRSVDMDQQGMIPDKLDGLLSELENDGQLAKVKIVYVCSYHQNPTGLTLSEDRRERLLEIVRHYSKSQRILLIEDAAYRELTYDGSALPSIKCYDHDNAHVALLQTFSKPFAPGFKTGYGLLPEGLTQAVAMQKGGRDFGSANLCQHVLLAAMQRGVYSRQVRKLCLMYAKKRDAMIQALHEHMPPNVSWTNPTGGLYVWLTLPMAMDSSRGGELFEEKMRQGVLVVPGAYCYPDDPQRTAPRNHMRLSFGVPSVEQIHTGIKRLATAIKRVGDC